MKKKCSLCGENKEIIEFYKKTKTTYDSRCKICFNNQRRERRKKKKELIKNIMSKECQNCGYNDERCLNNWLGKGRAKALLFCNNDTIEKEIKKSLVLCCNCISIKNYNLIKEINKDKNLSESDVAIQMRRFRRNKQKYLEELKQKGCNKCNFKHNCPSIFHFDHYDKNNKNIGIGELKKNNSIKKINDELKFTQILCANCHKIKTLENKDWENKI